MPDFDFPEGATPIDPDEAEGLLPTHITTRGELDRWEQDNIIGALAWLDQTRPTDILNERFAKELHKRMFAGVWKWAGQFRRTDKNLGVAWPQIPVSLKNLFDDTRHWVDCRQEPSDEIAVRFHHRIVSVHPFSNGNGRHARLMTDLLLENILKSKCFTWGSKKELSKAGHIRSSYIAALREADKGSYEPLLEFVRS